MSVPRQDYPWFAQRISPLRFRFCENFDALMEQVGSQRTDSTPRVLRAWDVPLQFRDKEVMLKVYEEAVNLTAPNCEQCRCNGKLKGR